MPRRSGILAAGVLLVLAGTVACRPRNPTEPPPDAPTHPTGEVFATTTVGSRPYGVAISANGVVYVARLDNLLLSRGQLPSASLVEGSLVGSTPSHVAFNPAGTRAYVTNQGDENVSVVDVASNSQTALIQLSSDAWNVLVSPDGARVYATTDQGVLTVINGATNAIITSVTLKAGDALRGIAIDAARNSLYVAGRNSGDVYVLDTRTNAVTRTITLGGILQRMAVSPNGTELYVANETRGLDIVTLATGAFRTVDLGGGGYGLAMSPDAAQLYVTVPDLGIVRIVSRTSGAVVGTLAVGLRPRNVAFSRRGDYAVITDESGGKVFFVR